MSGLFAGDPDYHAGRKPHQPREEKGSIPDFGVRFHAEEPFGAVTCTRCKGEMLLLTTSGWFEHHGETRPCVHCFKVSRVP